MEDEADCYGIVVCGVCGTLTPAQALHTSTSALRPTFLCSACQTFAAKLFAAPPAKLRCRTEEFCCWIGDRPERNCSYCWALLACSVLGAIDKAGSVPGSRDDSGSGDWAKVQKLFPNLHFVKTPNAGVKLNLDR